MVRGRSGCLGAVFARSMEIPVCVLELLKAALGRDGNEAVNCGKSKRMFWQPWRDDSDDDDDAPGIYYNLCSVRSERFVLLIFG